MNLLISGGGTGGHIYPGIAIAQGMLELEPKTQLFYVGKQGGLEESIVQNSELPIRFYGIAAQGMSRKISISIFKTMYKNFVGFREASKILKNVHPQVVFGTGGYVSASTLFAAQLKGIPTVILEQNLVPGLTNKFLGKKATAIALSFAETKPYFPKQKTVITGAPVRLHLQNLNKPESRKFFQLDPELITLLVFGGSQGAAAINRAVVGMVQELERRNITLQIILQTGKKNYEETVEKIKNIKTKIMVLPYIDDMAKAYAAADLVISRAGAISIAETTVCGLPTILIPYPYATANHQEKNARILEQHGAAKVILESELTAAKLAEMVSELISQPQRLATMAENSRKLGKPQATYEICNLLLNLTKDNTVH
jgi:UDP-N-acetylglucosamine--N-acetylmuramyl-(pentapeptide) pyrophosphoryl-undecaprenol N-acetylglucosamine transferase